MFKLILTLLALDMLRRGSDSAKREQSRKAGRADDDAATRRNSAKPWLET